MLDILLSQMGLKPEAIKQMGEDVVNGVKELNERIKRIEQKLGIEGANDGDES